ncbi:MAG: class I SAM-dependent methyltransferase [Candidatus Sericytochromatia bacterium]
MEPEEVAKQLRKPEGENGIKVAKGMNQSNAFLYSLTLKNLPIKESDHVLELGFGNGFFIKDVLSKSKNIIYHGIDFSEDMFNEASIINKDFIDNNEVKLNLANISSIPYPNDYFDIIFTINTLYFWDKPLDTLLEIKRVLKKDGIICISIRPKEFIEKLAFSKYGFNLYSVDDVINLYKDAKLDFFKYDQKVEPKVEISYRSNDIQTESVCIPIMSTTLGILMWIGNYNLEW